jgi:hypothetical protein
MPASEITPWNGLIDMTVGIVVADGTGISVGVGALGVDVIGVRVVGEDGTRVGISGDALGGTGTLVDSWSGPQANIANPNSNTQNENFVC